jgi:hypothetical protein
MILLGNRAVKRFLLWMVALLLVSGCTQVVRSSAPRSRITACVDGHPIPGYSNHLIYAVEVPTMPPVGVHIVRCFADLAQGTAHGFALPVPRGTLIVHGVLLLPTGEVTSAQCRAAARIPNFAVPCPALSPANDSTPLQLPNCGTVSACLWRSTSPPVFRRFIFEVAGFAVPPGYRGINGGPDGHFVLVAVQAAAVRASTGEAEVFCLHQPTIEKLTIEGNSAALVACPQGSYQTGGHVLLRWIHRGILVSVSFHGVNATNIDLALAEAHHLKWVSP